jgi:AcrR family transcriptional regulator
MTFVTGDNRQLSSYDAAMADVLTRPGLRERKKQRTHDDLQRIASRLFLERGYEAVTVEEIAAEADVSNRTFYRYFASKEDLVLGDLTELVESVHDSLAARPADEPPLDAIRAVAREMAVLLADDAEANRARSRIINATPSLQHRRTERQPHMEHALVPFIAGRLGLDPDTDLLPRLISACTVAAATVAVDLWTSTNGDEPLSDQIDRALLVLEVGFRDQLPNPDRT